MAANIPYQLRPNKFIDRELFLDLLCQLVPTIGSDKYAYLSMGGSHLVDHNAVYRQVGITRLFSFDKDPDVVGRQKFNRPIDKAVCKEMPASELPNVIDTIVDLFAGITNVIVWLDYTSPKRLGQLQELIEVSGKLGAGDVVRITLNANLETLEGGKGSTRWKDEGFDSPKQYRLQKLKGQLGDLVPSDVEDIGEDDFPAVLCKCIGLALSKVEAESRRVAFKPILLTSYRDGTRMVTATYLAVRNEDSAKPVPGLSSWPFMPKSSNDVTVISAPDLSLREKLRIDEYVSLEPEVVQEKLGFLCDTTPEKSVEAIASYRRLHRYYPSFRHVEH